MSVAGISSTSAVHPSNLQSVFQQRRSDFQQLSQTLKSGDLAGAQAAFDALSNLGKNASNSGANSGPFRNSRLAQDFNNLGQELQSGDLAGAQQAFGTLQQDIQASRHHFGGGSSQNSNPAPSTNSTPEIIINLGNTGSGGEQIIINLGAGNGSSSTALPTTATPAPATSDVASSQASSSSSSSSASGSNAGTTAAPPTQASAPEQIILNLNNGNNHPESITLNIGPGKSGEEITINVGKLSGGTQAPPNGLEISVLA